MCCHYSHTSNKDSTGNIHAVTNYKRKHTEMEVNRVWCTC